MARKQTVADAPRVEPPYDAEWRILDGQRPDVVIERHRATAAIPAAHEAFKRIVMAKAATGGLIHEDPATGYQARFHPLTDAAPASASAAGTSAE